MTIRAFLLSTTFFLFAVGLRAQPVPNTLDVIDRAIADIVDTVCRQYSANELQYYVSEHPDREWITSMLGRRMQYAGRIARVVPTEEESDIVFSIEDVSTRYTLKENSDSILRTIVVQCNARDRRSSPPGLMLQTPITRREDVITREVAAATESQQHSGSSGTIPPPPTSFWDDLAQPVIFIAAAATTVLLLFTVRSQ